MIELRSTMVSGLHGLCVVSMVQTMGFRSPWLIEG